MKKYKGTDWSELVKPLLRRAPLENDDDDRDRADLAACLWEASHRAHSAGEDEWAARIARHVRSFLKALGYGSTSYDGPIWAAIAACDDDCTVLQWTADNLPRAWWW